jgi:hypothetical protein
MLDNAAMGWDAGNPTDAAMILEGNAGDPRATE